ncbi:MAG: SPOR domain-containing protein [Candidatus Margulisbacteria bacterium]|nr:SPOR domain-containing protein [Candidatus Margulisiibacteriota bacterium]
MYRVVVGNFDTKQEAQDVAENIRADGFPVYMYTADGKHRLQIGAFKSKALATSLMTKATEYGYNAFISIK